MMENIDLLFKKAEEYLEKGNNRAAFKIYMGMAKNGCYRAQNEVAICYETGTGVTKDLNKALSWYKKGARSNDISIILNIADYYKKLDNKKRALYWFHKAVRLAKSCGNAEPFFDGNVYVDGQPYFELACYYIKTGYKNLGRILSLLQVVDGNPYVTPYAQEQTEVLLRLLKKGGASSLRDLQGLDISRRPIE